MVVREPLHDMMPRKYFLSVRDAGHPARKMSLISGVSKRTRKEAPMTTTISFRPSRAGRGHEPCAAVRCGASMSGVLHAQVSSLSAADRSVPAEAGSASRRRAVCLVPSTAVAGTRHAADIEQACAHLSSGDVLLFERDGENAYDPWAVRVLDGCGRRLGYVSCEFNEIVSRLMDGGRQVLGRVVSCRKIDGWHCVEMGVYLND